MHLDDATKRKLASSLTAEHLELIPYLPELLADLWEMGTSPDIVADFVRRHIPAPGKKRFLDLGCGKGPVSVRLAATYGAHVTGIDFFAEFIDFARQKAQEAGVASLCQFRVGDITHEILTERGYDCVILGALGDVLGPPEETVRLLKHTVIPGGYIIIDDAWLENADAGIAYQKHTYLTRPQRLAVFDHCGVALVDEASVDGTAQGDVNNADLENIRLRAAELGRKHPQHKHLFESYVRSQENEYRDLEQALTGVVWLLQCER